MRTQEEIDAIILDKHAMGKRPYDIAPFVYKPTAYVRERLAAMGITPHGQPNPVRVRDRPRTQAEIDSFIAERQDLPPSTIAHRLGLPTAAIRSRMEELGYEISPGGSPEYRIHPMWGDGTSEQERREAIWKRQKQAAREALRQMAGGSP